MTLVANHALRNAIQEYSSIARRERLKAARVRFDQSQNVIKTLSRQGGGGLLQHDAKAAHADDDELARDLHAEPEVWAVVEELVQTLELEAFVAEMQEVKSRFDTEKARSQALEQDLAVQQEEAHAAWREAQAAQHGLSVCERELHTLHEKLARAEEQAANIARAEEQAANVECVVCKNFFCQDKVSMAVCENGHAVCKVCFEGYADVEMSDGQRQIRCPMWPENLASCSGHFSEQKVAQVLSAQLHERYMGGIREQIRAEEYEKSLQFLRRTASESESLPEIDQEILAEQLRQSCNDPRQCRECHFGPVEHFRCNNLTTHHEKKGINNSCPRCSWFAKDIDEWPKWNGKVSSDAVVTRKINRDIAEFSGDHLSARLRELQEQAQILKSQYSNPDLKTLNSKPSILNPTEVLKMVLKKKSVGNQGTAVP